jgi:hypothetical protein
MIKKNDGEIDVTFKEYGCKDDVFGSDHRPVFLRFEVELKLNHLLNPSRFISPASPDQGFGKLCIEHFKLQLTNGGMLTTKKKFMFPLFFQLKFCGEFLTANPASFEKRMLGLFEPLPHKLWKKH